VALGEPIDGPFQPQDLKTIPENMGNDILRARFGQPGLVDVLRS
jgi:hypothetical protein